uniref:Subtilisin-like protease n=2 Tax=Oryza glaberrima TaxID=4538 RepID=I1NR07_ORYGL
TYVIVFDGLPASPSGLLATVVTSFQLLYVLSPIQVIVVQIDESFVGVIKQLPGVLAVIPDVLHKVHTTRSWDFLELERNGAATGAWKDAAKYGVDAIIGNVDTGVWPESASFKDDGYSVPSRWRGKCITGNDTTFKCNNKLIGTGFFNLGFLASGLLQGKPPSQAAELYTPRDYIGHGTHTLSTAGGGFVPDASVFGHGKGTAKGGSPLARLAAYKACYAEGCSSSDILAAMVTAVEDGVNVLSLSVGGPADDYLSDPIAIGAFYAVQKGVTVVCSASNSGPQPGSVTNVAPWILTVGASTMDRDFPAYVTFGGVTSSMTIKGQSLSNSTLPQGQRYAMINAKNANAANVPSENSTLCFPGSLDSDKVRGKIVVCTRGVNARVEKGLVVKQAGGVGMVLCNGAGNGEDVIADPHLIAAAHVSYSQCINLFNYLGSTDNPVGYITASDARLGVKPAPVMAAFSSRGPNPITPQILKPDITAPGVSVIAAYSEAVSPTELSFDDRRVPYNIMSGTSMSCPHVSGIVGLIKTKYPDWTPAMIKSAIMTTAITGDNDSGKIRDETGAAATPFAYGSGHVRSVQALDPGLVYDTTSADYADFLCALRPTQNPLPLPLPVFGDDGKPRACSQGAQYGRPEDLNYPSIAVPCLSGSATVRRRVKNVGAAPCRYAVSVTEALAGVKVTVYPPELSFESYGEEREFTVRLEVQDAAAAANYVFGSIEWSEESESDPDRKHRVRSPIVAKTTCG